VLEEKDSLDGVVQKAEIPGVYVLTSGPLPVNPAELISSPQMSDLVKQLAQQFDMILLDTPSLLAVTDAAAVSQTVNGVVLVVERGHARQESVRAAREQMADVRVNPVGVVVNRSKQNGVYDYYERMPT
jgi:capsular exopolysaccharide synthesis family protein